jgi:lipid-binding SYLF domain-containing protein
VKKHLIFNALAFLVLGIILGANPADAKTKEEIDLLSTAVLERFQAQLPYAKALLEKSKAVLILPGMGKGGPVFGGEYGEGALRIGGKTVDYYHITGVTAGLQLGGQVQDIVLLFMEDSAREQFESDDSWKSSLDASAVLVTLGTGGSLDAMTRNKPVMSFVIARKGVMGSLSYKISKCEMRAHEGNFKSS